MPRPTKLPASAGIAIGPILFVLAMLAVLAAVIATGGSDYQVASNADRITADIVAQANLIRGRINACNMQYSMSISTPGSIASSSYSYPCSDTTSGSRVAVLVCTPTTVSPTCPPSDPLSSATSLWNDPYLGNILLPQPTSGFNEWYYIDMSASGHGRCIWTTPKSVNAAVTSGLTRAASKFNNSTTYTSTAPTEVIYDPASSSQKFIVWITLPSGTADSHCLP